MKAVWFWGALLGDWVVDARGVCRYLSVGVA